MDLEDFTFPPMEEIVLLQNQLLQIYWDGKTMDGIMEDKRGMI